RGRPCGRKPATKPAYCSRWTGGSQSASPWVIRSKPPVPAGSASIGIARDGLQRFENPRRTHAGADAHRHHAVLVAVATHAVRDRRGTHRAGRAEWVAERDRAAERIDLGGVEFAIADHRQRLCGEGFVELDPVELVLCQAALLERLGNG